MHYERLRARALGLTGQDSALAEDLLHDSFIQFTLGHPSIDEIGNVEAYLTAMLRNMHASHVRRAARRGIVPIPLDELPFLADRVSSLAASEYSWPLPGLLSAQRVRRIDGCRADRGY